MPMKSRSIAGHCDAPREKTLNGCRFPRKPEGSDCLPPPMSGLAATETRLDQGAINVRIGEGRTAEVLRNLCYQVRRGKA